MRVVEDSAAELAITILQLIGSVNSSTSTEELELKQNAIKLLNHEIESHLPQESSEG